MKKKTHTAYAGYNASIDRIAIHSISGGQSGARRGMCEIYSDADNKAVWRRLKKDGWRIVKVGMVLVK